MRCPYCGSTNTQVKDSRPSEDHTTIRRRRVCADCGGRFTTFERVQLRELTVVKRSGRRMPFDRDKLMRSVQIALRKRPVDPERIERMVSGIVRRLENMGENDIKSETIGRLVMEALEGARRRRLCPLRLGLQEFPRGQGFRGAARRACRHRRRRSAPAQGRQSLGLCRRLARAPYIIAMNASDEDHMAQALQLARRGLGLTWPNPSVGSLVVAQSGEILARGSTAPGGRPHAEAIALERAGARAPRRHHLCDARALRPSGRARARLRRCDRRRRSCARRDRAQRSRPAHGGQRDRAARRGRHRGRTEGVLAEEAAAVTLGHILRVTEGRPAVTLKLAVGADGRLPRGNGTPVWITGPDARAHGHLLRAKHDAILVGP